MNYKISKEKKYTPKQVRRRGAINRYLQTVPIDLILIDIGPLPTEIVSDFIAPIITKFLPKFFSIGMSVPESFTPEEKRIYEEEYATGYKLSVVDFIISAIITALLELEPTSAANNTIGILINPALINLIRKMW